MNQHLNDAHENQKNYPEKIRIIGREMPTIQSMYGELSTNPDIKVFSSAEHIRNGDERRIVSEREVIDDLLAFGVLTRGVLEGQMHDEDRYVLEHVDGFIDSIHYLSHEAYQEAIQGLAIEHSKWLNEDENRRIRFLVQSSRKERSQWTISNDIASAIRNEVGERVDVVTLEELSECETDNSECKFVLADDWSVSGNLLGEDVSRAYRVFDSIGIEYQIDVNLLVARQDQIVEGIHTIEKYVKEIEPNHPSPKIIAYFQAPAVKTIYGYEALPSGSHSSVDYGFSQTLSRMYSVVERYLPISQAVHVPYIAKIIPKYGYNYDS